MVEVATRNAIDQAPFGWHEEKQPGSDWFDLDFLDKRAQQDVTKPRQRVRRLSAGETHPKVLAELPFGFWQFLTSKRYLTSLWIPALQHAFPYGPKDIRTRQKQVTDLLGDVTFTRNRAAHGEAVFQRNLTRDFACAHTLHKWIYPNATVWLQKSAAIVHQRHQ